MTLVFESDDWLYHSSVMHLPADFAHSNKLMLTLYNTFEAFASLGRTVRFSSTWPLQKSTAWLKSAVHYVIFV